MDSAECRHLVELELEATSMFAAAVAAGELDKAARFAAIAFAVGEAARRSLERSSVWSRE